MIKVNILCNESYWEHILSRECAENGFQLLGSSSSQSVTPVSPQKNVGQAQIEGHATKYITTNPQNCQNHTKKKESLRYCHA